MNSTIQMPLELEETDQKMCSLLVFRLGDQAFALGIETVVQIIPMLRLTPVPQVGDVIEGIANIHGTLVPVISARHHLNLPSQKPGLYTPIILASVGERQVGWIVDEVSDVISVPAESVISPGEILPEGMENAPVMRGLVYEQGQSILVLDPRYILRPSEFRKIDRAFRSNALVNIANQGSNTDDDDGDDSPKAAQPDRIAIETVRAALAMKQAEQQKPEAQPAPVENVPAVLTTLTPPDCGPAVEPALAESADSAKAVVPEADPSSGNGDAQSLSAASLPVEEDKKAQKNGKRGGRKGKIIPHTAGNSRVNGHKARRSINAVLADQFAALAKDVLETNSPACVDSGRDGEA